MAKDRVPPRWIRFVDEYLIDLNATKAYIRSGYKVSESVARRNGARLLTNAVIAALIEEEQKKRAARTHIEQDRVLLEIARLAFNDPRKAFSSDGALLPVHQWPDEVAAAISSVEVDEKQGDDGLAVRVSKVKFWDKGRQLELAGKHLGLFLERQEITGKNGGPIEQAVKVGLSQETSAWIQSLVDRAGGMGDEEGASSE